MPPTKVWVTWPVKQQWSDSHGVLTSPLSGSCLVLGSVALVDVGDLWHEWIIWVWISQERTDGEQDLGDGQGWRPLVLEDIQTDASI